MALMALPNYLKVPASELGAGLAELLRNHKIGSCHLVQPLRPPPHPDERRPITLVPYLLLPVQGHLIYQRDGLDETLVTAGDGILFAPGAEARFRSSEIGEYWRFTWDDSHTFIARVIVSKRPGQAPESILGHVVPGAADPVVGHVIQRILDIGSTDDLAAAAMITALLGEALAVLRQAPVDGASPSVSRWADIDRYIRRHLDLNRNRERTAKACNVSPSHVSRLIQQHTGMGFNEYLTHLRMQRACDLLREGRLQIRAIAATCGYKHPSHFIAVFKKTFGCTPGSWLESDSERIE